MTGECRDDSIMSFMAQCCSMPFYNGDANFCEHWTALDLVDLLCSKIIKITEVYKI